jgi:hypothetical protein
VLRKERDNTPKRQREEHLSSAPPGAFRALGIKGDAAADLALNQIHRRHEAREITSGKEPTERTSRRRCELSPLELFKLEAGSTLSCTPET